MVEDLDLGLSKLDMYNVWGIFRNPLELSYETTVHKEYGQFGLEIKDKFGVLFSTGPVTPSLMNIVEINKRILEGVLKRIDHELRDEESVTSQIFNRDGNIRNRVTFLSSETIACIIDRQRNKLTMM